MTVVRVQNALTRWLVPREDGNPGNTVQTAFRGMLVDIPDEQAALLLESGAVLPATEKLVKTGRLNPMPTNGSAEELRSWVSDANDEDVEQAVTEHPELADRIRDARAQYEAARDAEAALAGGLPEGSVTGAPAADTTGTGNPGAAAAPAGADAVTGGGTASGSATGGSTDPDGADLLFSDEDLDAAVAGNVQSVRDFLAANPAQASRVLEAENRRAAAAGETVRVGVEKAVEAASEASAPATS